MNPRPRLFLAAIVLALGMVVAAALLSKFYLRVRREQTISVKGYAEKNVTSDVGRLTCTVRARGPTLKESYAALQKSRQAVADFLKAKRFRDDEITSDAVETTKVPRRDAQGKEMNDIEFYDLAQAMSVESTNVVALKELSTSITELIKDGVDLTVNAPQFYVADLKGTKLELLGSATEDGYRRAVTLADKSHGQVGPLVAAEQGVFQITAPNSTDTSGYGVYDTATIQKTIKAIVTLEYEIKANPHPAR